MYISNPNKCMWSTTESYQYISVGTAKTKLNQNLCNRNGVVYEQTWGSYSVF